MALLPFSTLATYAPDGDHDTELIAELHTRRRGQDQPRTTRTRPGLGDLLVVSVQSSVHFPRQDVPDVESPLSRTSGHVAAIRTVKQTEPDPDPKPEPEPELDPRLKGADTHLKVTLVQSAPHLKP